MERSVRTSLLRGTGIVGALTLLSRILGFVRDLLTARLFGAGFIADAFFVAFRIPNLLRSFVAEGALTSAFVPVFASESAKGHQDAAQTIRAVSGLLLTATTLLSVLGIIFAPQIVNLFAPGFGHGSEKSALCAELTRIMLPLITCVSLVAMLNGALNSVQIYGASAMAQVWMNMALIGGALLAGFYQGTKVAYILAWSVLVGAVLQVLVQIPALRRAGFSAMPAIRIFTPATSQILRLMLPAIVGATVYQLQIFLNTVLASLLREGSVAWLFYADRLVQLPIGIFSVALASVLLPALSHAAARNDSGEFAANLLNSLRYSSFVIIPVATILYIYAEPLIWLIFERGAFSHEATLQTARAVRGYCLGLWAVSCHSMVVRAFIARKDTVTPTMVGVLTLFITLFLSLLFMGVPVMPAGQSMEAGWLHRQAVFLQSTMAPWHQAFNLGHAGLALASSVAAWFSLLVLILTLHRRTPLNWRPFVKATASPLLACLVLIALSQTVLQVKPGLNALLVQLPVSGLLFLLIIRLLKNQELQETFSLIRRKISKR